MRGKCSYSSVIMSYTPKKIDIGVREARADFSKYISRVKKGATINITDRGEYVAQIIPFPKKELTPDENIARLHAMGILEKPFAAPFKKYRPRKIPGLDLQKILYEERDRFTHFNQR